MSDRTVYAESLIMTIAKAFYNDTEISLLSILLRDKYLRDDDMGLRLSLPPKETRRTLEFLRRERLVKWELVDDLNEGGSQATKFWYVDINISVHIIRLRLFLLKRSLEQRELMARSSSMFVCPGYKSGICNGRYTESEAQNLVDLSSGLFLCYECSKAHQFNPSPPPIKTYTLTLLDNSDHLKKVLDDSRRVHTQLSTERIGNFQLRAGIYDLLHKVFGDRSAGPLSSNLPTDNRTMNIGSQRWKGTGRTYGIKAKKLAEKCCNNINVSAENDGDDLSIREYFRRYRLCENKVENEENHDYVFLKNAMGCHVEFKLERGAGARANLLVKSPLNKSKILDMAAARVTLYSNLSCWLLPKHTVSWNKKRRIEDLGPNRTDSFYFMRNNLETQLNQATENYVQEEECYCHNKDKCLVDTSDILVDIEEKKIDEMSREERRITFLARYNEELCRQMGILRESLNHGENNKHVQSFAPDNLCIQWEKL